MKSTGAPNGRLRLRLGDVLLVGALLAAPLAAALVGARGPQAIRLNLGPGDAPYVSGFTPGYEIDEKVATHWTTYDGRIALPLTIQGGPVELSYRLARILPETAVVDVSLDGRPVDHFACRGGVFLERRATAGSLPSTPATASFRVDSHDRKNLGLKMDWVRMDLGPEARVRLRGFAAWRPAFVVALLFLFLRCAGWGSRGAGLLAAPWAVAAAMGLFRDPWLVHRLLTGLPLALTVAGLAGLVLGHLLRSRGRTSAEGLRAVAALAVVAFLLRALAVSHPDFYYPDLRTHARLVEVLERAGLDFFRSPSTYIWEHGVWRTEAYGKTYAFPYTPAFHLPFALLGLAYDDLITTMKLAAAAISIVPLVLVWALARRLGASPLGTLLMVFVPTYTSRLSFAFLPALFGHAVDVAFLFWLAGHLDRVRTPRVWAIGVAFVAACQLAYVSGVMNASVLLFVVALLDPWERPEGRGKQALAILAMGLAGSLVSVLVYYRDFLGMVWDLLPRAVGHAANASRYPVQGWLAVIYDRTRDFFDGVYPLLALGGIALLLRRGRARGLVAGWVAAYLLLLLGRAKAPDVFLHGHETLLVTPLVCLASGEALAELWSRGRAWRGVAAALVVFLAAQGLLLQWLAIADQLANAL